MFVYLLLLFCDEIYRPTISGKKSQNISDPKKNFLLSKKKKEENPKV
jgi:hypothetical protein